MHNPRDANKSKALSLKRYLMWKNT